MSNGLAIHIRPLVVRLSILTPETQAILDELIECTQFEEHAVLGLTFDVLRSVEETMVGINVKALVDFQGFEPFAMGIKPLLANSKPDATRLVRDLLVTLTHTSRVIRALIGSSQDLPAVSGFGGKLRLVCLGRAAVLQARVMDAATLADLTDPESRDVRARFCTLLIPHGHGSAHQHLSRLQDVQMRWKTISGICRQNLGKEAGRFQLLPPDFSDLPCPA